MSYKNGMTNVDTNILSLEEKNLIRENKNTDSNKMFSEADSTWIHPGFSMSSCYWIVGVLCSIMWVLGCFCFFRQVIVLSYFGYTVSDDTIGIVTLFLAE
jgi:hypothetical protein